MGAGKSAPPEDKPLTPSTPCPLPFPRLWTRWGVGSQSSSSSQALPSSWGGRGNRDLHPCLHVGTERPKVPITQPQTRARPRHQLAPGGPCSSTLIPGARGDGQHPNVLSVFPFLAGHGDTCWLRPALDQPEWWAHTEVGMRPCDCKGREGTPAWRVGRRRGYREGVGGG